MRRGLAIAPLMAVLASAQTPSNSLKFEVASISPSKPGASEEGGLHPAPGGRRYIGSNFPLRTYLSVAFQVRKELISGGPGWLDTDFYDLNAEAERPSTIQELHSMLQNLLVERLKLKVHHESKEMQVYTLTVDKTGPKNLKARAGFGGGDLNINVNEPQFLHDHWTARCATMDYFAWVIGGRFDRPVVNQTKLDGCFDFDLLFTWDLPRGMQEGQLFNGVPIDVSGPSIFQALQNQLGLRMEAKRAPVDVIAIDHAEKPGDD